MVLSRTRLQPLSEGTQSTSQKKSDKWPKIHEKLHIVHKEGNANQTPEISSHGVRTAVTKNTNNDACWRRGLQISTTMLETSPEVPQKTRPETTS